MLTCSKGNNLCEYFGTECKTDERERKTSDASGRSFCAIMSVEVSHGVEVIVNDE